MTIGGLLIGVFSDWFAFNDAGQGKSVVLSWTLNNVVVLVMTLIAFVELPRRERHIADVPEETFLTTSDAVLPVLVRSLTRDTLRIEGFAHPLGTVGTITLKDVGDVRVTVIAKTKDGARLRLQTTPAQNEALILRFYADGDSPGVGQAHATALLKDLARRLSFSS